MRLSALRPSFGGFICRNDTVGSANYRCYRPYAMKYSSGCRETFRWAGGPGVATNVKYFIFY